VLYFKGEAAPLYYSLLFKFTAIFKGEKKNPAILFYFSIFGGHIHYSNHIALGTLQKDK
jgi:hypothetical protein